MFLQGICDALCVSLQSYFEAHEEHFTDLATMVAGAVKEHNDCVTSFRVSQTGQDCESGMTARARTHTSAHVPIQALSALSAHSVYFCSTGLD